MFQQEIHVCTLKNPDTSRLIDAIPSLKILGIIPCLGHAWSLRHMIYCWTCLGLDMKKLSMVYEPFAWNWLLVSDRFVEKLWIDIQYTSHLGISTPNFFGVQKGHWFLSLQLTTEVLGKSSVIHVASVEGCAFAWPSNVDGDELRCVSHGDIVGGIGACLGHKVVCFSSLKGGTKVVGTEAKVMVLKQWTCRIHWVIAKVNFKSILKISRDPNARILQKDQVIKIYTWCTCL